VDFANQRRFLMHDLVLGRVDGKHQLCGYLPKHGVTDNDLAWFSGHPATIDVLGLDYYCHSEIDCHWDERLGREHCLPHRSTPRLRIRRRGLLRAL
jgi:hypothetical protein